MSLGLRAKTADDAKRLLDAEGVCVIEDVLDLSGVARVKAALLAGIASDESSGVPVRSTPTP